MITVILIALILILSGVLGFILILLQYEHNQKKLEQQRKNDARWQTVFDRTDLKKV